MGSTREHNELLNKTLVVVSGSGIARVWRNETGKARAYSDPHRIISYGLIGSSDILGLCQGGRFLALEIKTGKATLTKEQKNFMRVWEFFARQKFPQL